MVKQQGLGLIEVIIAIVILGLALTSLVRILSEVVYESLEPQDRIQGQVILRSFMDEIVAKPVYDPDVGKVPYAFGDECNVDGDANGESGILIDFDDICDYDDYDETPKDLYDSVIPELSHFDVRASVEDIDGGDYLLVTVTVAVDGEEMSLSTQVAKDYH